MAQANCRLRKGDRPVTFSWLFNGIQLMNTDDTYIDHMGSRTSILTLDPVRAHHQGNYSCKAVNKAGFTQVDTTIIVNGTQRIFMESVYVGYRFYKFFEFGISASLPWISIILSLFLICVQI